MAARLWRLPRSRSPSASSTSPGCGDDPLAGPQSFASVVPGFGAVSMLNHSRAKEQAGTGSRNRCPRGWPRRPRQPTTTSRASSVLRTPASVRFRKGSLPFTPRSVPRQAGEPAAQAHKRDLSGGRACGAGPQGCRVRQESVRRRPPRVPCQAGERAAQAHKGGLSGGRACGSRPPVRVSTAIQFPPPVGQLKIPPLCLDEQGR